MKKRSKIAKFFLLAAISGILICFSLGKFSRNLEVLAAPLADTGDIFYVEKPAASSKIYGTSELKFKLYDDDNDHPEYDAGLYRTDCLTKFGTIAANDYSIRQSGNVYVKSWNSDGPILDQASVPNGNYCLKVCVTLKNGDQNYSVCDLRPISLVDKINQNPVITSKVPNTWYLVGQTFGYDVQASDPDGDTLTYTLTTAPAFLQINSATGAITSKGKLAQVGSFAVVVTVTDGHGGTASQQFTIKVVEEPSPAPSSVTIIAPTADSVFRDDQDNEIKWSAANISNLSKFIISFSSDGKNWTKIIELGAKTTSYNWLIQNSQNIKTGDYYIKVQAITTGGIVYEDISDKFSIISSHDEVVEDAASIIEVSPTENSEQTEVTEIKATFVPSQGAMVVPVSLIVRLDETEITDSCKISEEDKLVCTLKTALGEGSHKVYIEFTDNADKKASKEWSFTIKATEEEGQGGTGIELSRSVIIILSICGLVALLLFIPWLLYSLWRRRKEEFPAQEEYPAPTETDYTLEPQADLSTNYYDQTGSASASGAPIVSDVGTPAGVDDTSTTAGPVQEEAEIPEQPAQQPSEKPIEQPSEQKPQYDEFAIGESSLGGTDMTGGTDTAGEAVTSQQAQPVQSGKGQASGQSQQLTEEDIPDWLREEKYTDEEKKALKDQAEEQPSQQTAQQAAKQTAQQPSVGAAAQPINPSGKVVDLDTVQEKKKEIEGAELYSDYGLASQDDNSKDQNNIDQDNADQGSDSSST